MKTVEGYQPKEEVSKKALIDTTKYQEMYKKSVENPEAFLNVLKYQNIIEHPPAIRPQLAAEPSEDEFQELDLEDSIFAMFEPPSEL